jgi:hypothetical protein
MHKIRHTYKILIIYKLVARLMQSLRFRWKTNTKSTLGAQVVRILTGLSWLGARENVVCGGN